MATTPGDSGTWLTRLVAAAGRGAERALNQIVWRRHYSRGDLQIRCPDKRATTSRDKIMAARG